MLEKLTGSFVLTSLIVACGPQADDEPEEAAAGPDLAEDGCEESSCPVACGDRTCVRALGIGRCIDDKCSPTPLGCIIESTPENTCAEVCSSKGVVCVENGCEGATAFGYPGPAHLTIAYCGESTPEIRDAVVPIEGPCDAPLAFTGEGSFELYQCCCDDPSN